jgi:hypothetical protein
MKEIRMRALAMEPEQASPVQDAIRQCVSVALLIDLL